MPENIFTRSPVFNVIKMRYTEGEKIMKRIDEEKQEFAGQRAELPRKTRIAYFISDILDGIEEGIRIHQSKKSKWQRWGKEVFKISKAILFIVAGIYAKKI